MCDSVLCCGCTVAACSAWVRNQQLSLLFPGFYLTAKAKKTNSIHAVYVSFSQIVFCHEGTLIEGMYISVGEEYFFKKSILCVGSDAL